MICNHEYTNQEGRALEKLVIKLEQQLAAANAELLELKVSIIRFGQRAEQAEARIIGLEKELSDCKKMEGVTYQLRESLREEISSANARLTKADAQWEELRVKAEQTETQRRLIEKSWAATLNDCALIKAEKEQAEAQCAAMRAVIEYLSMRYSLCVQILPNGAWQVENQKRATEFAALEEKP